MRVVIIFVVAIDVSRHAKRASAYRVVCLKRTGLLVWGRLRGRFAFAFVFLGVRRVIRRGVVIAFHVGLERLLVPLEFAGVLPFASHVGFLLENRNIRIFHFGLVTS